MYSSLVPPARRETAVPFDADRPRGASPPTLMPHTRQALARGQDIGFNPQRSSLPTDRETPMRADCEHWLVLRLAVALFGVGSGLDEREVVDGHDLVGFVQERDSDRRVGC
jgi:hypothetical protein